MARVPMDKIIVVLTDEAQRITLFQQTREEFTGLKPDEQQMERAKLFDMAADLLFRIKPYQNKIRAMLARKSKNEGDRG